MILVPFLTLAFLLSIDTLKTCVILDVLTHSRHADQDRDLAVCTPDSRRCSTRGASIAFFGVGRAGSSTMMTIFFLSLTSWLVGGVPMGLVIESRNSSEMDLFVFSGFSTGLFHHFPGLGKLKISLTFVAIQKIFVHGLPPFRPSHQFPELLLCFRVTPWADSSSVGRSPQAIRAPITGVYRARQRALKHADDEGSITRCTMLRCSCQGVFHWCHFFLDTDSQID